MTKLIIFDLDSTISVSPTFYSNVYSESLTQVIQDERGEKGLEILKHCREKYNGKGELALFSLNISFCTWAERLMNAPLDLLQPQIGLVEQMRNLPANKVIFTGSPRKMAERIIERLGFLPNDFNLIVGWQEPEFSPLKWNCSPFVFEAIARQFHCAPSDTWAVGDDWATDLHPAQMIGMKTARIRKSGGNADVEFSTIEQFVQFLTRTKKS